MNQNQYQSQNQEGAPTSRNLTAQNAQLAQQKYNAESSAEFGQFQNYNQNQSGAPTSRNLTAQNAQLAQQNYNSESSSELAQSQGEISRLLMARAKQGFEFGSLGASQSNNTYQSKVQPQEGLEIDRSSGQVSQSLAQQSRQ